MKAYCELALRSLHEQKYNLRQTCQKMKANDMNNLTSKVHSHIFCLLLKRAIPHQSLSDISFTKGNDLKHL